MSTVRVAVFPAAGLGTRFLPATKAQPKEMLPLVDKPLVQYVVEEAVAAGIERIVLVTSRGKSALEDHFDLSYELERTLEERGKQDLLRQVRAVSTIARISSVRQAQALGLGHAVLQARDQVGDEPFAVLLSDDIVVADDPCIGQMIRLYERRGNPVIALQEVPPSQTHQYGIVAGERAEERVVALSDMVEKPPADKAPSNLAIIGRYLLPPEIFGILESTRSDVGGEIQLTSGLKALLQKRPIDGYLFSGTRYDAGDKLGFLKATVEIALSRPDLGPAFREYLKALAL
ncbi:MAG: UTP--glucose-1-phosphate uridylyltransferase GalU [Acidobacteria bacterium]|nr:UTP--glucose-1-phosphate uridylyltransferase GalU [Acidobacteriota bacterium]MCA1611785.1 UTP--glucose-1-phosphate uridylyltransferase GalU [Acidobacteriota bacterium]MCA1617441.1 UTP--glucose-1-phosphate uridylyltransferase GalU [Acidobacteriota bacterium]